METEFKHIFSVDEAQGMIAEITPKLERITELKDKLDKKGYDVLKHQYFGGMGPNGQKFFPDEMEELVLIVAELQDMGIEIKDLNKGLIDFPHRRLNGEVVYLCYLFGEREIAYWHTLDGGFQARRRMSDL